MTSPPSPRRPLCVCGRSAELPWCDESHRAEGWSCAATPEAADLLVAASPCLQNLARWLAHQLGGSLVGPGEGPRQAGRLVLLVAPGELELPRRVAARVHADEVVAVGYGMAAGLLAAAFPGARTLGLEEVPPGEAGARVRLLLEAPLDAPPPARLRRAFVSHAVRDEALLLPVAEALRVHHGAELFLCADSIEPGAGWWERIDGALAEAELFVLLLSEASLASAFCAYECGVARGRGLPTALLSLDGARPPAFLQHLQMADLPRLGAARPWLRPQDLLLEELLRALAAPAPSSPPG